MSRPGRVVRIVRSDIPGPYNLLDLPDGVSVEIIVQNVEFGSAEREIEEGGKKKTYTAEIARIYLPPGQFIFGAPYLDVLSGRLIATLKTLKAQMKKPYRLKLTARGREPEKWYEVEVTPL